MNHEQKLKLIKPGTYSRDPVGTAPSSTAPGIRFSFGFSLGPSIGFPQMLSHFHSGSRISGERVLPVALEKNCALRGFRTLFKSKRKLVVGNTKS